MGQRDPSGRNSPLSASTAPLDDPAMVPGQLIAQNAFINNTGCALWRMHFIKQAKKIVEGFETAG